VGAIFAPIPFYPIGIDRVTGVEAGQASTHRDFARFAPGQARQDKTIDKNYFNSICYDKLYART
jgi:hypothetical protein